MESPTGKPLLPPSAVPYLAALGAILLALTQVLPPDTVAAKVLTVVVQIMGLFGLVSPGLRRAPTSPPLNPDVSAGLEIIEGAKKE